STSKLKEPRSEWFPRGERGAAATLRRLLPSMRRAVYGKREPSVTVIARRSRSPFKVLVSTVISARTKDEVTGEAARRLFAKASTPRALSALNERTIAGLIYPAGFYRTKAKAIRALSATIAREFRGRVPRTMEALLSLPGVGRKTANLVLTLGFALPGICVDTHVHRVVNRLGVVRTRHPAETEACLRAVLARRYWLEINDLLVVFGKTVCAPVSPRCSICPVRRGCARVGVTRSR
ncbi:MAG TPA: endonuclease III, partial [Candidatus Bathyarchaeia archaeon]|nr:endonuclease III [Candidatus Bathyarchaeia archaeon]